MKRFCLCLAALMVAVIFCADADAALFGRRRGGGGGGMGGGAAAGNGLCNMAKQSAVRPNQVINGDFGLKAEPAPAVQPTDDRVTESRDSDTKVAKSVRPSHVSFELFDAPVSNVRKIASR